MNVDREDLADLRSEAQHDRACERADAEWEAACAASPYYAELAVEFLAERKLESAYREWLRENHADLLTLPAVEDPCR